MATLEVWAAPAEGKPAHKAPGVERRMILVVRSSPHSSRSPDLGTFVELTTDDGAASMSTIGETAARSPDE